MKRWAGQFIAQAGNPAKEKHMPHFLSTTDAQFDREFEALLGAKREDSPDVDAVVAEIIADI